MNTAPVAGTVDKEGTEFSPDLHQSVASKKGNWIPKKGKVADALEHRKACAAKKGIVIPEPQKKANNGALNGGDDPLRASLSDLPTQSEKTQSAPLPAENSGTPATPPAPEAENAPKNPLGGEVNETEVAPGTPGGLASQRAAVARTIRQAIEAVSVMVFGEDLKHSKDEADGIELAWDGYMEAKGDIDIPPGVMLCVCYASLLSTRFNRPTFRDRCTFMVLKIRGWFLKKAPAK